MKTCGAKRRGKANRLRVKLRRSAEALAKAEGRRAKRVERACFDRLSTP